MYTIEDLEMVLMIIHIFTGTGGKTLYTTYE